MRRVFLVLIVFFSETFWQCSVWESSWRWSLQVTFWCCANALWNIACSHEQQNPTEQTRYWLNFCFSYCKLFCVSFRARTMPSVLWRCWLSDRKGIQPVKDWVVGCWHGYLSAARCRLAYGPADATDVCRFSKSWLVLHFWYRLTGVVIFRFIAVRLSLPNALQLVLDRPCVQDTCRMAAPEFRYGLEVQQTLEPSR